MANFLAIFRLSARGWSFCSGSCCCHNYYTIGDDTRYFQYHTESAQYWEMSNNNLVIDVSCNWLLTRVTDTLESSTILIYLSKHITLFTLNVGRMPQWLNDWKTVNESCELKVQWLRNIVSEFTIKFSVLIPKMSLTKFLRYLIIAWHQCHKTFYCGNLQPFPLF